jgi:large subunit ribosomal protein L10
MHGPWAPGGETLNREQKVAVIEELTERMRSAETVISADFRGMTVKELTELRTKLIEVDANITVAKNTLARRAAEATSRTGMLPYLTGPTSLVWAEGDPAPAAKVLADMAKAVGDDRLSIKGGLMGEVDLSAASVTKLASLPSREVLLGQLAGGITAPLSGLAGALNNLIGGLARALGALEAQRAAEAPQA